MSHDLETLVYTKQDGNAWHGLGQVTETYQSSRQLLEEFGYNWNVKRSPVLFNSTEIWSDTEIDIRKEVPNRYVLYRDTDDQPLGIVGSNYQADAPKDIFRFADQLVPDGVARWSSVGTLWNGSFPRFFATMRLNDDWHIRGEKHHNYILFHTDYNGQYSLQILGTDVRVVCQNTVNLALNNKDARGVRIRHNASDRESLINQSLEQIQLITGQMERLKAWAESNEMQNNDMHHFVYDGGAFGVESDHPAINKVLEIIEPKGFIHDAVSFDSNSDLAQKIAKIRINRNRFHTNYWEPEIKRNGDTLYSLYNASIGYADYGLNTKATGSNTKQEARNKSVLFGMGAKMKAQIQEALIG